MKKTLSIIIICLTFLIIYFLQENFFSWFNISGIMPNLFVIYILFLGLFLGKIYGVSFGIIFGLLLDFFVGKRLGINAITYGAIGLLGGLLTKNFSKDSRLTIMLIAAGATFVFEILSYIMQIVVFNIPIEVFRFLKIVIIETIFNSILIIIIYPLINKTGDVLTKIFNEKNILTRYY